jgi:hypothetical protein
MKHPVPNSAWTDPTGDTWWYRGRTQNGHLFHSETGSVLFLQDWEISKSGLRPQQEDPAPHTFQALLVGGATGSHFTRLQEQAAALNVIITHHVPYKKKGLRSVPSIPAGTELVLFLVSHSDHSLYRVFVEKAKKAGVPILLVRSQGFSHVLEEELSKMERFGGPSGLVRSPEGAWTWTGLSWIWEAEEARRPSFSRWMALIAGLGLLLL